MKRRSFGLILTLGVVFALLFIGTSLADGVRDTMKIDMEFDTREFSGPKTIQAYITISNTGDSEWPGPVTLYYPNMEQVEEFGSPVLAAGASKTWLGSWTVTQNELNAGKVSFIVRYTDYKDGELETIPLRITKTIQYTGKTAESTSEQSSGADDPDGKIILRVEADADRDHVTRIPDTVRFTITVSNDSAVDVSNITVRAVNSRIYMFNEIPAGESRSFTRDMAISIAGTFQFTADVKDPFGETLSFDSNPVPIAYVKQSSELSETPENQAPVAAAGPMADFVAAFAAHADALEESFEIPCTEELQEMLFTACSIPDTTYFDAIKANEGMYAFSYRQYPDKIEFVDCRYYEGKRIVHAWKNNTVSELTPREQETLREVQRMVAGINGTDLEKERAVHDLLCRHITYYTDSKSSGHEECDCAVGAILNGSADCDGYSDAFYLLGSLTGLEVRLLKGDAVRDADQSISGMTRNLTSGGHIWNLVRINGKWVMLDVTWDDQEEQGICYYYFNTGTDAEAGNHIWEPQILYIPVETVTANDVRPAGLEWFYISDWDNLRTILADNLGRKEWICLQGTAGVDLRADHERLNMLIDSLGVEDFNWTFDGNRAEIRDVIMYPEFRVVTSREEIVSYLAGCKARRPQEIRIYCPQELFNRLLEDNGAGIFAAMQEAGLRTNNLQYGINTCVFIIFPPEWQ